MPRSSRDVEFSTFVRTNRAELLRTACLLTAGDTHLAEDLVQTALAKLYVAWPLVLRTGTAVGYARRIIVTSLTIAPKNAKDRNPNYFVDKLVLALTWQGFKPITAADARRDRRISLPVAGRPGWFHADPIKEPAGWNEYRKSGKVGKNDKYIPNMSLYYQGPGGEWLMIQVPRSVGWTKADLAEFAAGVTVLKNAAKPH